MHNYYLKKIVTVLIVGLFIMDPALSCAESVASISTEIYFQRQCTEELNALEERREKELSPFKDDIESAFNAFLIDQGWTENDKSNNPRDLDQFIVEKKKINRMFDRRYSNGQLVILN